MFNDATIPDVGIGPWSVRHNADTSFYELIGPNGKERDYPLGKTAYRAARQRNDAWAEAQPRYDAKGERDNAPPVQEKPAKRSVPKQTAPKAKPAPAPKAEEPKAERAPLDLSAVLFNGTREEWLNAFVAAARPVFAERGHELPEKIRVSVGFPHNHRGGKVIGQCWHEAASADGTREILVTPLLDDSARIADVLTHELAHTLFGPDEKHGRNFAKAVTDLGLIGKPTATEAGDGWREWAEPILKSLGAIPHARLDPTKSGVKKQGTRLLKAVCGDCGFTFRATAKWLNGRELTCPDADCGGPVDVEGGE